jgi:hypothetical protein
MRDSLEDLERRWREVAEATPDDARRTLLRILDADDEDRARLIGQVYHQPGPSALAELLIDLEEDPRIRRLYAAELRAATFREERGEISGNR